MRTSTKAITTITLVAGLALGVHSCRNAADQATSTSVTSHTVAAQIPTLAARTADATATAGAGPVLDSDRGPEPAAPSTRATAWASVPTSPAAAPSLNRVTSKGKPRGAKSPGKVDGRNVDKVAEAFLTTAFTVDAAVDNSPQAGFARAASWAAPAYRPYLVKAPAGGGSSWQQLLAVEGWTEVEVTPVTVGDKPADKPSATIRSFRIVTTTHGNDTSAEQQTSYAYLTLARSQTGTWQVTSYTALD